MRSSSLVSTTRARRATVGISLSLLLIGGLGGCGKTTTTTDGTKTTTTTTPPMMPASAASR